MRVLARILILSLSLLFASPSGAFAGRQVPGPSPLGQLPVCVGADSGAAADCGGEDAELQQTSAVRTGFPGPSGDGTIIYRPYDRLTTGPDGQACVTTGYVQEGTTPADGVRTDLVTQNVLDIHGLPLEYPPCPEQPLVPGLPAPVETPSMVARRHWEQVPLPKPQPRIAPGRAITGKLAYLETRGAISHTYTNDTAFGPLVIVATGSYVIDWGDGEKSGPYSFEGKPWPDGLITHDYLNVGSYDIIVTERWTATWRLGGESGVLRTLQTTGRIDDFPVEQIQAVIAR
jgi:hypothetical protein